MSKPSIREQLAELQEIVASFDRDDVGVEEALEQFERGSKLADEIDVTLTELKTKITVFKERFDQE